MWHGNVPRGGPPSVAAVAMPAPNGASQETIASSTATSSVAPAPVWAPHQGGHDLQLSQRAARAVRDLQAGLSGMRAPGPISDSSPLNAR